MVNGVVLDNKIEEPDEVIKKIKLQHTGRQYTLAIPVSIIDALDLEKGDLFIFKVPLKNKNDYSITIEKNKIIPKP